MKNYQRNKNGITLIALVITIVILLILAGITISSIMGENNLFNYAKRAKNNTLEAQEIENSILSDYEEWINGNYRENKDNFGTSTVISNVNIEVLEINGEYVKLKVVTDNDENVRGYGILVNNELVRVSENKEIVVSNLNCNTNYNIVAYALDKFDCRRKSEVKTITTLEHQYAYKRGQEFETLTGGWERGAYNVGSFTKETDHMNLYYASSSSYSDKSWNSCNTINSIDVTKYTTMKSNIKIDNYYLISSKCNTWACISVSNPKMASYSVNNSKSILEINALDTWNKEIVVEQSLDLTEVNENIYPTMFFSKWYKAAFSVNFDIYDVWFE